MITQDQMDEWVHEVETRPESGALIVRLVAQRLKNLTERNEELLAENIQMRAGQRVEEYERKIASLEYQLDLLRRQFGGELPTNAANPQVETMSILLYNPKGRVLRAVLPLEDLAPGAVVARFADADELASGGPARLAVTHDHEEILFVIDSGRVAALPVAGIQACEAQQLRWASAHSADPHAGEELAAVIPVGKMTLFDYCVQVSRRAFAKRMMRASFEQHVSKSFIGTGIKSAPDKTFSLVFCNKEERIAFATKDGFLLAAEVNGLAYTIEEVMKLSAIDYLVSAFTPGQKETLLVITNTGKAVNREVGWLETAATSKSRGQALLSTVRREAGTRVIAAASVSAGDWCLALDQQGIVTAHRAADLISSGALPVENDLVDFATFEGKGKKNGA